MPNTWDESRLLNLISSSQEEGTTLEYKAAAALVDNREIRKDVSAMANSAGGIIIYGMTERKDNTGQNNIPNSIEDVGPIGVSKESLDQIIAEVSPRINGILIEKVGCPSINGYVYVVIVPPSLTAHQASDRKYYKRYNFHVRAMEDYEIRDVMSRARNGIFNIEFFFDESQKKFPEGTNLLARKLTLTVNLTHIAGPLVNNLKIEITIPAYWRSRSLHRGQVETIVFTNVDTQSSRTSPIYPQETVSYDIFLDDDFWRNSHTGEGISYIIRSDSAEPASGQVNAQDLDQRRS